MLADLNALLDKPLLLLIVLTIGGVIGTALESALNRMDRERRQAYWRGRKAAKGKRGKVVPFGGGETPSADFAADQLKAVMKAEFRPRALLNKSEAQVFKALDRLVIERNPGWQVMAQVCLGEFLASEEKDAYFAVNSKRVDFALMDGDDVTPSFPPAGIRAGRLCCA